MYNHPALQPDHQLCSCRVIEIETAGFKREKGFARDRKREGAICLGGEVHAGGEARPNLPGKAWFSSEPAESGQSLHVLKGCAVGLA